MIPPENKETEIPVPDIEFIAKTFTPPDGKPQKGVSVLVHCLIVGLVAKELVRRQPDWLKQTLFPEGSELSSAAHDIGKISPGDQQKLHQVVGVLLQLVSPAVIHEIKHPAVSEAALQGIGPYIPKIAGRHHGASLSEKGGPTDIKFGGAKWQAERLKVLSELKRLLQTDWPEITSYVVADVLSGLTTVADWIGSGGIFDAPGETIQPDCAVLAEMASEAVDAAGFVPPRIKKGLSFTDVFRVEAPRDVQEKLIEAVDSPGVYVLEAPMGLGKTEAALYAAYQAMSENRATGIYFALPTQLTSNKMVDRVNQFLDAILEEDCQHRRSLLLHGSAWLMNIFGEDGEPGGSWFDHRKRGLLAPFAVGTIDQALMAAMNVRHGFVRTFGLAGKVVILDEIHSYDSYTNTIIERLISTLKELHCTVIILSATLTGEQRNALLGASEDSIPADSGYPLISALPSKGAPSDFSSKANETARVSINFRANEAAIEEALIRAERGEQVLWMENTVDDAQKYFKILSARASSLGIDVGLLHSRFLKTDREQKEKKWVNLFGKEGTGKRSLKGRILIGTQVLEQSLDIDGDFLITRICPTDMLLQRLGRLWRHRQNDALRPQGARREAWILSPSLEEAISSDKYFGKTAWVYAPYILCRTLEAWQGLTEIVLPDQIRNLIEHTYSERVETGEMAVYRSQVETQKNSLEQMARIGLSTGGQTWPESHATTRYSNRETVDVLLVRNRHQDDTGVRVRLLDGYDMVLSPGLRFRDKKQWRKKAAVLQKNTVSVPEDAAPAFCEREMKFLKEFVYLGDNEARPFRAALVTNGGELAGLDQQAPLEDFQLRYDSQIGYVVKKQ